MALNHGCRYSLIVTPSDAGSRLVDLLAARFTHSPREVWASRIAHGEVEVANARRGAEDVVRAGEEIGWHRPPWEEPDVPLTFDVVHEDASLLCVIKPRGLPTLPAGGFLEHTLLSAVRRQFPDVVAVHRLGRHTSGLVLFARSPTIAATLGLALRERRIVKDYRALGSGSPSWDRTTVDAPIGLQPHPRLGTVHAAAPNGRRAVSHLAVVERRVDAALIDARIETGRPHQIRIHLAFAGHPLVGDPLYGPGGLPHPLDPGLPGDGGYFLHAARLAFAHPLTGVAIDLRADPPAELESASERGLTA